MERETSKYGTNFTESEALLAVIAEDYGHAWLLIGDMSGYEKKSLASACEQLSQMCWRVNPRGT
jgi:hypothetical protein